MVGETPSATTGEDLVRLFPDCREDGETTLRQCQLVMIRMLKILDHICAAHGISYWMTAGTLIGALRHGGMIPWDCDIDVGMTVEDYEALARISHALPPDMFLQNRDTDPTYRLDDMPKLRDRHSNYTDWKKSNPDAGWHNGLQVDLILYRENEAGQLVNPVRGTAYDRSEIFPLERIRFEGASLLGPHDPSRYIMRRYGNFMQLPPPQARFPHEGRADPFTPCDHRESRPYRFRKLRTRVRRGLKSLLIDRRFHASRRSGR